MDGIAIAPVPNGQTPAMARKSVDLPAPDGPVTRMRSWSVNAEAVGCDLRGSVGQLDQKLPQFDVVAAGRRHDVDRTGAARQRRGAGDRLLEPFETRDHRSPFRQRAIDRNEK